MKGSSKVIMGTTIAIVVLLVVVLGLVLVLLAELYYSLLFRRRNLDRGTSAKSGSMLERSDTVQVQVQDHWNVPSTLNGFYSQGVLEASRRFLFPKLPSKREHREKNNDIEKPKHGKLCNKFLKVQTPHQHEIPSSSSLSLLSPLSSPSISYISLTKPHQHCHSPKPEIQVEDGKDHIHYHEGGTKGESLMYISNPIYDDNDVAKGGMASLPLSPMKELPEKACSSLALRDAIKCLGNCGSECNCDNDARLSSSSSSYESPYISPSW